MTLDDLMARKYAKWILFGCAILTVYAFMVSKISNSYNLNNSFLVFTRILCISFSMLAAAFAYAPKPLYGIFLKFHKKLKRDREVLLHTARSSDVELLESIYKSAVEVQYSNILGWTPLHEAAQAGNDIAVKFLLDKGANPNARSLNGNHPLYVAMQMGRKNILILLLNKGSIFTPDKEFKISHAMYFAASGSPKQIKDALVNQSNSVNDSCSAGYTPMHYAALFGNAENLTALLKLNSNVEKKTLEKLTMLHFAAISGDVPTLEVALRAAPGLLDVVQSTDEPPINFSILNLNDDAFSFLINAGARFDLKDKNGLSSEDHVMRGGSPRMKSELAKHKKLLSSRAQLQSAMNVSAVSIASNSRVNSSHSQSNQQKCDKSDVVDQVLQCIQAERLLGIDAIGASLGKDIGEFVNNGQKSRVHLFWGNPDTGKTSLVKRLVGQVDNPDPMLDIEGVGSLVHIYGQDIAERKLDLKSVLSAVTRKSILVIDDADLAFDPEEGSVSTQDATLFIRSVLTSLRQQPLYVILVGNFAKRRGTYAAPLTKAHLTDALGQELANLIDFESWEFKKLSSANLIKKLKSIVESTDYRIELKDYSVLLNHINDSNPDRPIGEFEKLFGKLMRNSVAEPDSHGLKHLTPAEIQSLTQTVKVA